MKPERSRPWAPLVAILAATTLFTLLAVNLMTLVRINSARFLIAHTQEVHSALTRVRSALVDAETGQRGYLLTGDASYLEPFKNADRMLPGTLADAKQLTAKDPSQRRRISELEGLASKKMEEVRKTVELHQRGDAVAALAVIRTNQGKSWMDEARALIEELRAEENRLLEERTAAVRRSLQIAIWIDVGAGLGLLALGIMLFTIDRDIARRRELEQGLREAAEFQERFVGILGHDLRNPLAAQAVATDLLKRRGGLSPDQASNVDRIAATTARMARMVDQLLDLTRARLAGGIPVERKPGTDLAEVARDAVEELRITHPEVRIAVETEQQVRGARDADRIAQVVSNLAGNAIQHGAGSPVEVRVRRTNASAILEVCNGGPPIPANL